MGYLNDNLWAGMPRTTEGQKEIHSADGKTFVLHVTLEKWEVWFTGLRVDTFTTREQARRHIRMLKLRARMLRSTLSGRINIDTMACILRGVRHMPESMRNAVYEATRTSPLLTAAMAREFPLTFCPHDRCILPIAHEGDHYPDDKGVFDY